MLTLRLEFHRSPPNGRMSETHRQQHRPSMLAGYAKSLPRKTNSIDYWCTIGTPSSIQTHKKRGVDYFQNIARFIYAYPSAGQRILVLPAAHIERIERILEDQLARTKRARMSHMRAARRRRRRFAFAAADAQADAELLLHAQRTGAGAAGARRQEHGQQADLQVAHARHHDYGTAHDDDTMITLQK